MTSGEAYYRYETVGGCSIITLLPELNDKQWADIEKVGTELVDRLGGTPAPRYMVDLTLLSYMGSAMVALIVRLYKSGNGRNGRMVVVNQHELVYEVLKLAGLTKLWTIVDNRAQGFVALGVKPGSQAADGSAAAGGNAILVAGVVGTLGAIAVLALQLSRSTLLSPKVAQMTEFGFAALGIVGGILLINQSGMRRNVGIALLGICLLAVLSGILAAPEQAPTPARPRTGATLPAAPSDAAARPFTSKAHPLETNAPAASPAAPDASSKNKPSTGDLAKGIK